MKFELREWEYPLGHPKQKDRDITVTPYERQEFRVAGYFNDVGIGGGDDPVGSLITLHRWNMKIRRELEKDAVFRQRIQEIENSMTGFEP